ncbi:MAG: hypothetical protein Q8J85_09550 [Sulfuricurvum sp.]|nr:hypothetical protein [Sulfuricurvum sp.]MDP3022762.1 hypothetical protein [Sulfuricurvum sp.]
MSDDLSSKAEEAMQLEADRDIDEYKQQLDAIAHLKEMKRQRNKNLLNIAKIIVVLAVFIYIAMSVL